ncbi:MAG: nicotinate (nicotinamide) nucleotide adenylyltransferase [Ginsengibacter sp.]
MKIGLYFGSFNPIHTGHLIIASHIVNNTLLEQVWFVISPQNPLKKAASLLNEHHRKHLIDLSIEGEKKLKTSNVEFKLPKPSYTIDTLTYLSEKYPHHEFSVIMGSDSFSNIKRWKNYEVLSKNYPIYIYERPGFKLSGTQESNIIILQAPLLEISSTHIRELVRLKKSIRYLVPDIVKEEIERQQYYS